MNSWSFCCIFHRSPPETRSYRKSWGPGFTRADIERICNPGSYLKAVALVKQGAVKITGGSLSSICDSQLCSISMTTTQRWVEMVIIPDSCDSIKNWKHIGLHGHWGAMVPKRKSKASGAQGTTPSVWAVAAFWPLGGPLASLCFQHP